MIVNSLRFGQLEVPKSKIISMVKPVLGFENLKKYFLLEVDEIRPFLWLQSVEEPAVAFLVVNPLFVMKDYRIEINSMEIADLEIKKVTTVETYVIVTLPDAPEELSANMQGPILINTENNLAKQLVLVNSDYRIKQLIFESLGIEPEIPVSQLKEEPVGV